MAVRRASERSADYEDFHEHHDLITGMMEVTKRSRTLGRTGISRTCLTHGCLTDSWKAACNAGRENYVLRLRIMKRRLSCNYPAFSDYILL